MGFGKALTVQNNEALMEFVVAQQRYKDACSKYARVRLKMIGSDNSDECIIEHHRAKIVHKAECKLYAAARAKYVYAVHAAAAEIPKITNQELLAISVETNERAIAEELKRKSMLSSISQEDIDLITKATNERRAAQGLAPLAAMPISSNPDVTEDGKITFDPEFDKL